jgi:tetratricopeptide (TPR) repeat protein
MLSASLMAAVLALTQFSEPLALPERDEVMAIPPELRAELDEGLKTAGSAPQQRIEWLSAFLFSPEGLGLEYTHDSTGTIAETYASREANCLSATLMFLALADELGFNARPQEYRRALIWSQEEDTVYRIAHVNVHIRTNDATFTVDFEPYLITDGDRRPRPIGEDRLLAHFYNNRAAEHMSRHEYVAALNAIQRALSLDERFVPAWNNLGVVKQRQGRYESAEDAFLRALSVHSTNESVLSNLASLYAAMGETDLLKRYERRLQRAQRRDPFHQFEKGLALEDQGQYQQARRHFRRAISHHDREPLFHFALARAHYELGAMRRATWALRRAIQTSQPEQQPIYEEKLNTLQERRRR